MYKTTNIYIYTIYIIYKIFYEYNIFDIIYVIYIEFNMYNIIYIYILLNVFSDRGCIHEAWMTGVSSSSFGPPSALGLFVR